MTTDLQRRFAAVVGAATVYAWVLAGCGGNGAANITRTITLPTPNLQSSTTSTGATIQVMDYLHPVDPNGTAPVVRPAVFNIFVQAPQAASVAVLAYSTAFGVTPAGTFTVTDSQKRVVYTTPLSTGPGTTQTLAAGQQIESVILLPSTVLTSAGDYQATVSVQVPGNSAPATVGPLPMRVQ